MRAFHGVSQPTALDVLITNQVKIFVISGARSLERREFMKAQLECMGLSFEFVDACFPDTFIEPSIAHLSSFAIPVKGKAEYGCAQSHQMVYRRLIDNFLDMAIVLEDDAELAADFPQAILILPRFNFDVCMLGHSKLTRDQYKNAKYYFPLYDTRRVGAWRVGRSIALRFGAVGYAVSNRGAEKLLRANARSAFVADNWSYFELAHDLTLEEIRPLVVFEDCIRHGSHIDDERGDRQVAQLSSADAIVRSKLYWFARSLKGHLDLLVFLLRGRKDRKRRSWKG